MLGRAKFRSAGSDNCCLPLAREVDACRLGRWLMLLVVMQWSGLAKAGHCLIPRWHVSRGKNERYGAGDRLVIDGRSRQPPNSVTELLNAQISINRRSIYVKLEPNANIA